MILRVATAITLAACVSCSSTASTPSPSADAGTGETTDAGGPGTDTWASYASGFFSTYCVECHDENDSTGRNFKLQAKVESEKNVIRCGVAVTRDPSWACAASPAAKQFPIGSGPKPTDAERTRLVAWITAGAP